MILDKTSLPMQGYLQMTILFFVVVSGTQRAANDLHKDLEIINNWDFQWKMSFNRDPTKQAQEVIFSPKAKEIYHPPLVFNSCSVSQSSPQNNLVLYLTPN